MILDNIIEFSLSRRLIVMAAAVLVVIAGCWVTHEMEVDVFPDLNAPTVVVMTEARGMAPEEVERMVTYPIEAAVNGGANVRRVRSSSTTGFSVVWVEFDWGMDVYRARQVVSEKLSEAAESLPPQSGRPVLAPQASILGEVMFIGLSTRDSIPSATPTSSTMSTLSTESKGKSTESKAAGTSMEQLRTLADWVIRPRLLATGGVAQVAVLGGDEKEYRIQLSPTLMRMRGVGLNEVVEATSQMNANASGGTLYQYGNEYIVRGAIATADTLEIGKALVKLDTEGNPICINDIATVTVSAKEPKTGVASISGKGGVLITVTKQPDVATLDLTDKLDKAIEELKSELPSDVVVSTDLYRQERFINSSINNIKNALVEGAFFVVLVLFIFLMNPRTTLISLLSIPLSLLVTILTLRIMGLTINTMSIGGIAIAIGSLVDDAIVDVENVFKRLRENRLKPIEERLPAIKVVFFASKEVRTPIFNSTLIIIVSFVPLFFLSGMEGRMLVPLGVAFIVSLIGSTIVALTLTPVLCSYLLARPLQTSPQGRLIPKFLQSDEMSEPRVVIALKKHYKRALDWALAHQRMVVSGVGALFALALVAFFTLGRSFLPPFNEGSLTINISSLPGISLEESDKIGRQAEIALMEVPEVASVARKTGRAELDEHALGVNVSEIEVNLATESRCTGSIANNNKEKTRERGNGKSKRTKKEIVDDIRERLALLPGVNIEIGQPISHRIDAMLSGTQSNIAIKVFGTELGRMYQIGNDIKREIEHIEGLTDVNVEQQIERPQLRITPRREVLARYGITLPQFSQYVNTLLGGETVSQVFEGNRVFDLTLKMENPSKPPLRGGLNLNNDNVDNIDIIDNIDVIEHGLTISAIRDMPIETGKGEFVPLEAVAKIESFAGPNTINRENVERKLVVSANVEGRDLRSAVNEIRNRVGEEISLPDGYHIEYGGQFESEEAASRTLMLASLISILVIYLLLYNQFRNARQSLIVMLNLPLALIGGVFAIRFTSGVISIPAIIGFISLFGIATRNGMLLVDRYNDLREQAVEHRKAVVSGALDRLNPIIMTALTSALALVPLALGSALPGNEIQSPMAIVILGGLLSSTLLNAFLIPISLDRGKNATHSQSDADTE